MDVCVNQVDLKRIGETVEVMGKEYEMDSVVVEENKLEENVEKENNEKESEDECSSLKRKKIERRKTKKNKTYCTLFV